MSVPAPDANGRGAPTGPDASSTAGPLTLAEVLAALLRGWKRVLAVALVALVVAGAASFLIPRKFTARTMLYLSQPASESRGQLAAQFQGLFGPPPGSANARLVQTILTSRTLADSIARRFGPVANTETMSNPDGSIRVDVTHRDPEMAARVANAYAGLLNSIVLATGAQTTRQKEAFLRRQLDSARADLERSEEALVRFARGRNAHQSEEQGSRALEAAVQMEARVRDKQVEVSQLRRVVTPSNPRLRAAEAELASLRGELRRITSGGSQVLVPLRESPELRVSSARLMREFTADEQISVALTAALAQTRIDANNALPVVSVIDPAKVPQAPTGLSRPIIVVLAGALGFMAGVMWVVASAVARAARRQPHNAPLFEAWDEVRPALRRRPAGASARA